ncbi:hypothetical protein OFC53_31570, partial [Escherichia coli]|nr:hypothetical protein [Escherichia coli]
FFVASISIGIVGILSGIAASARYDLPSGASIVITLFIAGMLFNLLLQPFLVKITKPAFVRD